MYNIILFTIKRNRMVVLKILSLLDLYNFNFEIGDMFLNLFYMMLLNCFFRVFEVLLDYFRNLLFLGSVFVDFKN